MKKVFFYFILFFAVLLSACTKVGVNDLDTGCSSAYSIPICTYNAKVFDLIKGKSSQITVGTDSTINIECYNGKVDTVLNVISFDDCDTIKENYPFSGVSGLSQYLGTTLPAGEYEIFSQDFDMHLNFNSETDDQSYGVDTATFVAPKLELSNALSGFTLNSSNYIEFTVTLVGCKNETGKDVQMSYQFFSTSTSLEKQLDNFIAIFDEGESGNNIKVNLTCKLHSNGTQTLSENASLSFACSFSSLGTVSAYGAFRDNNPICTGRYAKKLDESVASLFEDSYLPFYDPELTLKLKHNVGVDIRFKINNLYVIDKASNIHKATNFNASGYDLGKPARPATYYGKIDSVSKTFHFDRENGLNELFKGKDAPDSVVFEYSVYLPKKSESECRDFIQSGNGISFDIDMQMKMQLDTGSYITLVNDVDADFSDLDTISTGAVVMDSLYVYFDLTNGIPFDLTTSFNFLNASGIEMIESDSIFVQACEVDEEGKSKTPSEAINVSIAFGGQNIKEIMGTKKLRFKTKLVGKNGKKITIKASDALQVKVYVYPKFKANAGGIFK